MGLLISQNPIVYIMYQYRYIHYQLSYIVRGWNSDHTYVSLK